MKAIELHIKALADIALENGKAMPAAAYYHISSLILHLASLWLTVRDDTPEAITQHNKLVASFKGKE